MPNALHLETALQRNLKSRIDAAELKLAQYNEKLDKVSQAGDALREYLKVNHASLSID